MDKSAINPQTGKPYAVNPATGQWDDNYFANVVELRFKGQSGMSSGGGGGVDFDSLVRRQLALQKEINAPVVQSLEASIPEIQQRYAGQQTRLEKSKESLTQRYYRLLSDLKSRETSEIGAVQQRNKQEYSARGIPLSSTAYSDANLQATQPVSQFYSKQYGELEQAHSDDLLDIENLMAELSGQETSGLRSVRNAIASAQAGSGQSALETAMQLVQQQQQQAQFDKSYGLDQQRVLQSADEFSKTFAENQRQFNTNLALEQAKLNGSSGLTTSQRQDNTKTALEQLQSRLNSPTALGNEKNIAWQFIHALEPKAKELGIDTSYLWALYNSY